LKIIRLIIKAIRWIENIFLNRERKIKIIETKAIIWGVNELKEDEVIKKETRVTKIKIKILTIWVISIV
jgi:hypothetical protein